MKRLCLVPLISPVSAEETQAGSIIHGDKTITWLTCEFHRESFSPVIVKVNTA